jgi:hypothetical protein
MPHSGTNFRPYKQHKTKTEDLIMAEIKDLEKNVEEGELSDEALDGAVGGMASISKYRNKPSDDVARTNSASDKRENC